MLFKNLQRKYIYSRIIIIQQILLQSTLICYGEAQRDMPLKIFFLSALCVKAQGWGGDLSGKFHVWEKLLREKVSQRF